ncbi:uncharacterized protein LOC112048902 [Bicyclus anynana]|uniref:Uncharacterized protein LOC112048902 n=1 Tax=Bicyclus anynana TaxID=110368 RepID=A0ABM3M846_BICAN|nr:uncharacterized protein LOC112048902 [Bicyclus anynana]
MNQEKDTDSEKEEVRKTRPRLVMTPAVCMDDIEDPRTRQILCTETYTSVTGRLMRETLPSRVNVKAPLPAIPLLGDADPFALPKMRPPLVSREWRMETLSWDRWQLRLDYDQTKEFWLGREPTKCIKCDEAALIRTQRKMLRK